MGTTIIDERKLRNLGFGAALLLAAFGVACGGVGTETPDLTIGSRGEVVAAGPMLVYRYYQASSDDHDYETNYLELGEGVAGWVRENVRGAFSTGTSATSSDMVLLYSAYSSTLKKHFLTTNQSEATGAGYGIIGNVGYIHLNSGATDGGTLPLYRYFNTANGGHFYTTNFSELGNGSGPWHLEATIGYVWTPQGPIPTGLIYRYANTASGDYFYTQNYGELGEQNLGWVRQMVPGWFSLPQTNPGGNFVALGRYSANSVHFYTTNPAEAAAAGYQSEGSIGYISTQSDSSHGATLPLYRYLVVATSTHLYTTDFSEGGNGNSTLNYEGIVGYAQPFGYTNSRP